MNLIVEKHFKNNVQNCYEESFKLKIFFHLQFMQILEMNYNYYKYINE